ncbi:MAG: hypothetical protein EA403_00815 [Spirochaetaceae bacterium]|nr:MAG: hypothetical protein EA403_00815 [Spirochaetaceae bacterium]
MNERSTYQPPYTITAAIVNLVAEISEAVGRLTVLSDQARALRLRRINRIRTIHGSLAIEGNTLSESQITAIIDTVTASTPEVEQEVTPEVRLLSALAGEMTRQQLKETLGLKDDEHFRKAYLLPALDAGLIEMTIPDKPRSSKQKYRLTDKGRQLVARSVG